MSKSEVSDAVAAQVRSASRHPRSPHSENRRSRAPPWLWHRPATPTDFAQRYSGQSGLALPGAAQVGIPWVARLGMEAFRDRPRLEDLSSDPKGQEGPGRGHGELAAAR